MVFRGRSAYCWSEIGEGIMIRIVLGAAALMLGANAAQAQTAPQEKQKAPESTPSTGVFKTARQVSVMCTSSVRGEQAMCDWFIMSAHDMMKFYADSSLGGNKICVPDATKAEDLRNAVLAYWQKDPSSLQYSAVSTIYNALSDTYPCD
jgi:hypothetical protein